MRQLSPEDPCAPISPSCTAHLHPYTHPTSVPLHTPRHLRPSTHPGIPLLSYGNFPPANLPSWRDRSSAFAASLIQTGASKAHREDTNHQSQCKMSFVRLMQRGDHGLSRFRQGPREKHLEEHMAKKIALIVKIFK